MDNLEKSRNNQASFKTDESQDATSNQNDDSLSGAAERVSQASIKKGMDKQSISSILTQNQRPESLEAALDAADTKAVSTFLQRGSESLSASRLKRALMSSITKGNADIVGLLLKNDKVVDSDLSFAVESAIDNNQAEVVSQFLKSQHYDPTEGDNEDFIYAIELGHTAVVKAFLQSGRINPAEGNQHALNMATRESHFEIAHLLVDQPEVDPSINDSFIFREAALAGQLDLVKKLILKPTVDINAKNNEALFNAISNGHSQVVELLVRTDRIDILANDGKAFKAAAKKGDVDTFSILLDHPSSRSEQGIKLIKQMSKKSKPVARFLSERHNKALLDVSKTIKIMSDPLRSDVATNIIKLIGQDKRLFPLMSNEHRQARVRKLAQKLS